MEASVRLVAVRPRRSDGERGRRLATATARGDAAAVTQARRPSARIQPKGRTIAPRSSQTSARRYHGALDAGTWPVTARRARFHMASCDSNCDAKERREVSR